jgi:membrane protein DedA with SNARE-associated domain
MKSKGVTPMTEWIKTIMDGMGYFGIGLLMFLENLFPPIPSELIMPLAGYNSGAGGNLQLVPAILAGVVGTILGALPWYYASKTLGSKRLQQLADRYGRWMGISGEDIDKSSVWFQKHGNKAVFFGRLVPGIRTLISIPAGLSHMPFLPFLIFSTLGTTIWVSFLTLGGFFLGQNYELVETYVGALSKPILAIVVVGFLVWVIRRQRRRNRA